MKQIRARLTHNANKNSGKGQRTMMVPLINKLFYENICILLQKQVSSKLDLSSFFFCCLFLNPVQDHYLGNPLEFFSLNEVIGSESESWIPICPTVFHINKSTNVPEARRLGMWVMLSKPGLCHVCVTGSSSTVDRSSKPADTNQFYAVLRIPKSPKSCYNQENNCNHYCLYKFKTEWSWKGSFMFKTKLGHILS